MKRIPKLPLFLFLFLFLPAVAVPGRLSAQGLRVAVVDSRRLARESNIGKAALAKIQEMGESLKADIQARQDAYEKRLKDFQMRAPSLQDDVRRKQRDEIEQEGIRIKRAAEDAQRKIQREGQKIEEDIQKKVLAAVHSYAAEHDFDVVLDTLQCLFNAPRTDVTSDVLSYMDSHLQE